MSIEQHDLVDTPINDSPQESDFSAMPAELKKEMNRALTEVMTEEETETGKTVAENKQQERNEVRKILLGFMASKLFDIALPKLGSKYAYKGPRMGPNQFDCSGFVKYVFGNFLKDEEVQKIKKEHTVAEVFIQKLERIFAKGPNSHGLYEKFKHKRALTEDLGNAKPGDFIFFWDRNKKKVTHLEMIENNTGSSLLCLGSAIPEGGVPAGVQMRNRSYANETDKSSMPLNKNKYIYYIGKMSWLFPKDPVA